MRVLIRLYKPGIRMLLAVLFLALIPGHSCAQDIENEMMSRIAPLPADPAYADSAYWVWGSSVIEAGGRYHMFVSRWPRHLTFHPGWMIESEIVHAISDTPEGPYAFSDVALPARGAQYWDGRATHNPKIVKHGDTYVLFYMGSTHPFEDFPEEESLKLKSKYSIVARSNKRIGVAWSKSPDGPWTRMDAPVLDTKPGTFYSFLTSNPAPWINEDGSVLLVFKSRKYKEDFPFQSSMAIGVAGAPHFKGPYELLSDEPIFSLDKNAEIEDPCLWKDQAGYHILAKDQRGEITGEKGNGVLVHSKDGISWELDKKPFAYSKTLKGSDGKAVKMGQLERCSVLLDKQGRVTHLFFATMDGPGGFNNSTESWNLVLPLDRLQDRLDLKALEQDRVVSAAERYLLEDPVTISAYECERSQGGRHDFYSEGDYWWPDPEDPDGPYIRRDGQTNPDNFTAHRKAMRNMSMQVPALVAAYKLTGDEKYALHALAHLKAWFTDSSTMMNPNLLYAQAIKGRVSGRGIGIIDTIHLIEVAEALSVLLEAGMIPELDAEGLLAWFGAYNHWMTTHPYGLDERDHGNNHSAWWTAQVAAFAGLTGDKSLQDFCREHYKTKILPGQLDSRGRFSDEITRTKPYSYSLFNLEAFALICELLSTEEDDLWDYSTPDGRSTRLALDFHYPYWKDKSGWPFPPDIEHFDELPVRGSALLFAGLRYQSPEYIQTWKALPSDTEVQEIIRTFVIRQPLLWVEQD